MAFSNGFTYRRKLTFANSSYEQFTNFPVLIIVDDSANDYPELTSATAIDFFDSNNTTGLSWECAEFNDGGKSYYFVKIPILDASDTGFIFMYYGGTTSAEDKTGVWDSNYVAVYHMKDETTSTILDSTSNNHDGTKGGANTPIETDGDIGKCQEWDGVYDYIDCGDTDVLGDLTVEAYVYFPNSGTTRNIVAKDDNNAFRLRVESDDGMWTLINDGGGLAVRDGPAAIPTDQNNYLAWTFDASESEVAWHYNTVKQATQDIGKNSIADTSGELYIGKSKTWGEPFDGKLMELRISNYLRPDNYMLAQDKILRQQNYVTFGTQYESPRQATHTGSITFAGGLTKISKQVPSGALSFTGVLNKSVSQTPTGGLTFSGALNKIPKQTPVGVLTFTGTLVQKAKQNLTGAITFTGTIISLIKQIKTGAITFTGTLIKKVTGAFTGAITFTGTHIGSRIHHAIHTGAITFVGGLTKTAKQINSGAITPTGALIKKALRIMAGVITPTGALNKLVPATHEGLIRFAGGLSKTIHKITSGAVGFRGTLRSSGTWNRIAGAVSSWTASVSDAISWADVSKPTTTYTDVEKPETEWEGEE